VDLGDDFATGQHGHVAIAVAAEVAQHLQNVFDENAEIGGNPNGLADAGEVDQLAGDLLAAGGFAANHLQVVTNDVGLFLHRLGIVAFPQPQFKRFSAQGDGCQRVVDLV